MSTDNSQPLGEQGSEFEVGPSYTVLKALVGEQIPKGLLGPHNVPIAVLGAPIKLTMKVLNAHNRRCKLRQCPALPAALWTYHKWRPEAIATLGEQIHKVLWTDPEHSLISSIRQRVIAERNELAKEISAGHLLVGRRLDEVLRELPEGVEGARALAALLWAVGFNVPGGDALFRILIPLTENGAKVRQRVEPKQINETSSGDRQLRKANRDRKAAERIAADVEKDLRASEKALNKMRQDHDVLRRTHALAAAEIVALKERIRDTQTSLVIIERDAERASKSNAALRQDLRDSRELCNDLEVKRSELAKQIALDKRYSEQFRQQHKTGAPAMWEFLQRERERITDLRYITSGGARQRANREWTAHKKLREAFLDAYPAYVQDRVPVKAMPRTGLRFTALGGSDEIGRSCYLLQLGKRRILVDCGISPGVPADLLPDLSQLDSIDALLLTHAHTDHIGWVPALVSKLGDIDIYCSEATAALLPVMLDDCRRHYIRKITSSRERAQFIRNAEPIAEEYDELDVRQIPNLVITCPFGEEVGLPFGGVTLTFYPAGHILGAASILVEESNGRRIFFSGDFSSFPQLTVPAAQWPEDLGEVDLLVLESTYGNRNHHSMDESRRELVSFIRETVEQKHGSVVLASFALGRAQELLSVVASARERGEISESIPIHVDGMIRQINPIYQNLSDNFDLQQNGFNYVSGISERREIVFEAQSKPAIIVTTSGMMMGGPVVEYARQLLPDHRNRIVLTGYQDEGAPSRALVEMERVGGGKRVVEVVDESGDTVRIESAMPAKQIQLSAHADQSGLVDYASRLSPKVIALVHGHPSAQDTLAQLLAADHEEAEIVCGPAHLDVS